MTYEDLKQQVADSLGIKLGEVVHVTPAIDENCDHEWPDEDEHGTCGCCSKCGLSFMRYINSCCP